jgi:hypothetical protein
MRTIAQLSGQWACGATHRQAPRLGRRGVSIARVQGPCCGRPGGLSPLTPSSSSAWPPGRPPMPSGPYMSMLARPAGAAWRACAVATPSREGPQSSTRRRYPVAYDPHWVRTPSASCLATGATYHGHGSPLEAGRVSHVNRAGLPQKRASNDEKVSSVKPQTKEHKADRYNTHFEYKAGDRGFLCGAGAPNR